MKIDPNAPAYPMHDRDHYGLTIRAEIAARVMAGMFSNTKLTLEYADVGGGVLEKTLHIAGVSVHKAAIREADALIAELNREAV